MNIIYGGYKWKTGECILFDYMYLHNPSKYKRTVIYMDIKRNHLYGIIKYIDNNVFIKLFVQDQHKQRKN